MRRAVSCVSSAPRECRAVKRDGESAETEWTTGTHGQTLRLTATAYSCTGYRPITPLQSATHRDQTRDMIVVLQLCTVSVICYCLYDDPHFPVNVMPPTGCSEIAHPGPPNPLIRHASPTRLSAPPLSEPTPKADRQKRSPVVPRPTAPAPASGTSSDRAVPVLVTEPARDQLERERSKAR